MRIFLLARLSSRLGDHWRYAIDAMKKQISIYRIERDEAYAKLFPVDRDAFNSERKKSWAFDGTWRDDDWVSLEMRPSDTSLRVPDI